MATVRLQFENSVLKEYEVGLSLTIGRLPDNTVVIDNPAVSGHHACLFRDGDHFVVEDLHSTNGTFVNEKSVTRHTLQDGDRVLIGKHQLVFDQMAGGQSSVADTAGPALANLNDTVYLDTKKHKELLTKETPVQRTQAKSPGAAVGVLRVLAGRAESSQYYLESRTCLIGKSDGALVRLQGWFKPRVAVVITRDGESYMATPVQGKTRINNQPLSGRHNLKHGDVLDVSGLKLEFSMKTLAVDGPTSTPGVTSTERRIAG